MTIPYLVSSWNQLGDQAILTGAVHNVKVAHPEMEFGFLRKYPYYAPLFDHNPDFTAKAGEPIKNIGYGDLEDERNARRGNHVEAQTRTLCERLGIPMVPITTRLPMLYLTDEEIEWGRQFQGKWIVNANFQVYSVSKAYPYWQEVVNGMNRMGLTCCQIGGREQRDVSCDLAGVEDWRGRTTIRQLMSMAYNAEGIVSPSSGIVHLGAAFRHKSVVLVGARENPDTLYDFCRYVKTECEYQNCIAHTTDQCRRFNGKCPCMDFDPELVLSEIEKVFFE